MVVRGIEAGTSELGTEAFLISHYAISAVQTPFICTVRYSLGTRSELSSSLQVRVSRRFLGPESLLSVGAQGLRAGSEVCGHLLGPELSRALVSLLS